MLNTLRPAVAMTLGFTLLTGLAYPLAITGLAGALVPQAATGSLITEGEAVIGSLLIAQPFTAPEYLHPRDSASGFNAAGTGTYNLGPTSAALLEMVEARRAAFVAQNGGEASIDAVTSSGSGLDPDISPENALAQAERIATARGVAPQAVRDLIAQAVEPPFLGLYGPPHVNVLAVNIALDAALPMPPAGAQETPPVTVTE